MTHPSPLSPCSTFLVAVVICCFVHNTNAGGALPADLRSRARTALILEQNKVLNIRPNSEVSANKTRPTTCDVTTQLLRDRVTIACPPSKFRSPTGECNNVIHRDWGSRGDIFLRLLAPNYANKINTPRTSVSTHGLPDADDIVNVLQDTIDPDAEHPHITSMLPAWGKLLAYDLVDIASSHLGVKCCKNATQNREITSNEELDQCYVRAGPTCKEYKRTVPSFEVGNCEFCKC